MESIWGHVPVTLKRTIYLSDIRSVITDSTPSKLGKEFTIVVQYRKQDYESESDRDVGQIEENERITSSTAALSSVHILQLRAETAEIRMHWTDAFRVFL